VTENGIIKLEPGFTSNLRKNYYLDSITKNLTYENLDKEELIKDEEYINKLKDINEIDKLITTSIIDEEDFFDTRHKDVFCGNDYKEVVDQCPRSWINEEAKKIVENYKKKESKKLNKKDALEKYDNEFERTKNKRKTLEEMLNISKKKVIQAKIVQVKILEE
jgi:hypothetical protein